MRMRSQAQQRAAVGDEVVEHEQGAGTQQGQDEALQLGHRGGLDHGRVDDLRAAPIVEGHVEDDAIVVARHFDGIANLLLQMLVDAVHAPAMEDLDAVPVQMPSQLESANYPLG